MRNSKYPQEQLKEAEWCFELGDEGHELAERLHESAAKQLDIASRQKDIGVEQHINADKIDAQATEADALGRKIQANAELIDSTK
jgi:hypothetical protein